MKVLKTREKISTLTSQLDQYRSIRGQLTVGSLQQENKELKQRNGFYKSIIEQHGLAHLLGRNKDQQQTGMLDNKFSGKLEFDPARGMWRLPASLLQYL